MWLWTVLCVMGASAWTLLVLAGSGMASRQLGTWNDKGWPILQAWLIAVGLITGYWFVWGN